MTDPRQSLNSERFDAVLFDLDGVLTSTAKIHAACWKSMFDDYLQGHAARSGQPFVPFDIENDYKPYVDGKPRYDGVRSFLESRNITLPAGSPEDAPAVESICGLGNRKDELVKEAIAAGKVEAYPGSVALVQSLRATKMRLAVVSSSNNCREVLEAAHMLELFDARVDGLIATEQKLRGKPEPDTFLYAARLLGVAPERGVVVEDAQAGVAAGQAGGFGLVVGVDRGGNAAALREHGAHIVVADLAELVPSR
ncbi:MAG: HAD family hydrolase [Gemmataceae bacterium]